MARKLNFIVLFFFFLYVHGKSQSVVPEIKVSSVFEKGGIFIGQPEFMVDSNQSLRDTIRLQFKLINDLGTDTTIIYSEGLNEWVEFKAVPDVENAQTNGIA